MSWGVPSARARSASRRTTGSEQLPPIQPRSRPSALMTALSPGWADVGGSVRTAVASAHGVPAAAYSCSKSRTASPIRSPLLWRLASRICRWISGPQCGPSALSAPALLAQASTRCTRCSARPRLDIPRLEKSSGNLYKSRPSDALAIGLAVDQTAVQDADQAICKGPQSLMVSLAAGAQDVVSMSRAFGASQGGECPLVAGVGEPAVARHPRENDLASAGGLGDGRSARIALASLRMQKSGSVITELGHSPGAEDNTESRQTEVDLGVRVLLKTRGQLLLEGCDLQVELFDDCHGGGDTMTIGFNEKRRRLQLRQSQLGFDLSGLCLQISLPAPMAESRDDFCFGEGASTDRGRGLLQDGNCIGRVQVVERAQGSGVKVTQRVAKLVDLALSSPDQTLMSSGKYLDRLGEVGVSGQRPIFVAVGADEVRQDPSIAGVGLRTRGRMAVSIAARGQRINGIDLVAGGHQ